MNPFSFARATSVEDAVIAGQRPGVSFIAGGTNLVDLLKEHVARPNQLVDITRLALREVRTLEDGGLSVGALVTNAELARHPRVEEIYPLLARAILAGASPQLRNVATTGGNLLQRTRCYYFYDAAMPCNKREPGSGCPAILGQNRMHAILGASDQCIATHPSDMCVALAALDARVVVQGAQGERRVAFADFHRLPEDLPARDTNLVHGELVTAVELPKHGFAAHHAYLKVRDRASYAFALVSVAAALELEDGRITAARIALGGVAHKPWRDVGVEAQLTGAPATRDSFRAAADALLREARGYAHNTFKIELARRAIVRALELAQEHTS